MKRLLIIVLVLAVVIMFSIPAALFAASINLDWDNPTEEGNDWKKYEGSDLSNTEDQKDSFSLTSDGDCILIRLL